MLEVGQPLHAFDNTRLSGAIHARMARPAETILLLNEQTLQLQADVLLIADDQRPLAMGGIMGGEESGITLATTEVFLEAAFFAPPRSPAVPVATASFRTPHIVSNVVSILAVHGVRWNAQASWSLIFAAARPVRSAKHWLPCPCASRFACARRGSPRCLGCRLRASA
jgi:hypothetical protein